MRDHSRNCIWIEFTGPDGLPDPATVQTLVDDSGNPFPVDIETDPASGDLFYVNINAGALDRMSYTAP